MLDALGTPLEYLPVDDGAADEKRSASGSETLASVAYDEERPSLPFESDSEYPTFRVPTQAGPQPCVRLQCQRKTRWG